MIKIIKGTYGYCDGKKIIPKTAEDEPFTLTPEQEARLVDLKIAEYVGTPVQAQNITTDKQPAPYNVNMKLDELKAIAAIYGVACF